MADYRLALRRDTAANWTSANPVLAQGEPGFETDTDKLKIGDGTTAWSSLPYYAPDISEVGGVDLLTPAESGQAFVFDGSSWSPSDLLIEKQYKYDGALEISTGTARLYVPANCSGFNVNGYLGTQSSSGDVTADILVNGSIDTTLTIAALSDTGSAASSTALSTGDYITVDITGAGSGANTLYITLSFIRG